MRTKLDHQAYLEEWKANCDLSKREEDVKQKRFAYFLTIQFAFIALFGTIASSIINNNLPAKPTLYISLVAIGLCVIAGAAVYIALIFKKLDSRARDYVDVVKGKLLIIEAEWLKYYPYQAFTTFTEQFKVLVHRDPSAIDEYINQRRIGCRSDCGTNTCSSCPNCLDRLKCLKLNPNVNFAAHIAEEKLVNMFIIVWLIVFLVTASVGVVETHQSCNPPPTNQGTTKSISADIISRIICTLAPRQ